MARQTINITIDGPSVIIEASLEMASGNTERIIEEMNRLNESMVRCIKECRSENRESGK